MATTKYYKMVGQGDFTQICGLPTPYWREITFPKRKPKVSWLFRRYSNVPAIWADGQYVPKEEPGMVEVSKLEMVLLFGLLENE